MRNLNAGIAKGASAFFPILYYSARKNTIPRHGNKWLKTCTFLKTSKTAAGDQQGRPERKMHGLPDAGTEREGQKTAEERGNLFDISGIA